MTPHNRPITGRGWLVTRQPRVFAGAQPSGITVRMQTDTRSNLYKPIRVTPELKNGYRSKPTMAKQAKYKVS